jgi:protein-S-isoprenylcysteine O-methyltransferase Ste14
MWDRFLRQAAREHGPSARLALMAPAGVLFLVLLPSVLLILGRRLDGRLRRGARVPAGVRVSGGLLAVGGWLLGLWSNYIQFTQGRGTPVPVMATQELIVQPPYAYCRNPMALGTILAYFGLAVASGSPGAALHVAPGAMALLLYIKLVEERELVCRFGDAYVVYRHQVPFLLPKLSGPAGPERTLWKLWLSTTRFTVTPRRSLTPSATA